MVNCMMILGEISQHVADYLKCDLSKDRKKSEKFHHAFDEN